MSLNISNYENELKQHSYRQTVRIVVGRMDRVELVQFLSNLGEDQLDEELPSHTFEMSTEDMRKLTCLVVWEWGWEGSEYFVETYR